MTKHVLVTQVTGSADGATGMFELGKLSLPITSINRIFTDFTGKTTLTYGNVTINIAESAGIVANRINNIIG